MRSAPARPVRALCEAVAVLLSKNMTCARPRCNATPSKHFPHTSHCTLHTSHLSFFHLVSCLPICQLRSSWLFSCHLSAAQTFSCVGAIFNLSRRFCTSARLSVTPKPNLDATAEKRRFWSTLDRKRIFRRKISCAKIAKICWQIALAAWLQPLQYDLRDPAAKDNSITHAAAAPSNLDAATTMRSAETELQSTIDLHATASEIAAPKPNESRRQSRKKTILQHFVKGFLEGKLLPPKLRKSADKSLSQPGCTTPIRFTIFSCKRQ